MNYLMLQLSQLPVVLVSKNEASIIIIGLKLLYDMKRAGVSHIVKPVVSNGDPNITITIYSKPL